MAAATPILDVETQDLNASAVAYRIAGLALATILPAIFWVVCAVTLGGAAGITFAPLPLAMAGTAIAVFLGTVCAPIIFKA